MHVTASLFAICSVIKLFFNNFIANLQDELAYIHQTIFLFHSTTFNMASFSAVFSAAGSEECEVVSCEYDFKQSTDDKGRPSSVVQGAFIKVSIVSTDSVKLISWMLDPYKRAEGKIVFKRGDQDSKMKELVFKEAYCVGYKETFDARQAETQASMVLSLIISANKIDVNGATLDNKWV